MTELGPVTPEELAERGWEGRSRCRCLVEDEGYVACPPQMCEAQDLVDRLNQENAHYRRILSDRSSLEKRFVGAIRAAVNDHGPIDYLSAPSAAKRVIGEVYAAFREAGRD